MKTNKVGNDCFDLSHKDYILRIHLYSIECNKVN